MPLFSVICIAIAVYLFFRVKDEKERYISILAFHIFVCMNIEAGAFLAMGEHRIKYNYFTELVMCFFSLMLLPKVLRRIWKGAGSIIPSVAAVLVGILNLILNPVKKLIVTSDILIDQYWDGHVALGYPSFGTNVVKQFIQYAVFIFVLAVLTAYLDRQDYKVLLKKTGSWCKIAILWGYMEFALKNFFSSNILLNAVEWIFGYNDSVFTAMEKRGSLYRLSGLTTEAAHFAYALFIITIVMFANYYLQQEKMIWVILSFLIMVFSMSFTSTLYAVGTVAVAGIVFFRKVIRPCRKFVYVLGLAALLLAAVAMVSHTSAFQNSYYGTRLKEVLNDELLFTDIENVRNYTYTSSRIRLVSIISTISLMKYRPLFGIGLGVASAHGSFALILSELGIVGTFLWLRALFFHAGKRKMAVYNAPYCILIFLWCAIGLVVGSFLGFLYNAENYALMTAFLLMCDKDAENGRKTRLFRREGTE